MPRVPYSKPALDYAAQLQQLKDRGLTVDDDAKALHLLENISYYRLSGYWYPMIDLPKEAHQFKPNSTFENAFRLYCFDRELRLLIISQLEKIEVAIRAKMIYIMSHAYGPFWYQDPLLFTKPNQHANTLARLANEFARSDEEFIKAFNAKYSDPLPPSWMIFEVSSFGNLSSLYSILRPGRKKREIANYFGLDDSTFISWIHSFTYVRNICAHHSRLWNKVLDIRPQIPRTPINTFIKNTTLPNPVIGQPDVVNNKRSYFLLSMIIYFLNTINPSHSFKKRFIQLLDQHPMVDTRAMGFPDDWKNEVLWQ